MPEPDQPIPEPDQPIPEPDQPIPERGLIAEWLQKMHADEETIALLVEARDVLDASSELRDRVQAAVASVTESVGVMDAAWPTPTGLNAHPDRFVRMADAVAVLCCVPPLLEFHDAHGVPRSQTWSLLADLPRHFKLYRAIHGVDGFEHLHWLANHLRGLLYDMGRLQVQREQPTGFPFDEEAMSSTGFRGLQRGEAVLSVHIPGTGPMDATACDASLSRARREVPRWFPGERYPAFVCFSWLLDPQLAAYLPPDSNILRFQRRFELFGEPFPELDSTKTYIFRVPGDTALDALPQRTTLERAYVRHVRDGGEWYIRAGWFPADAVAR
jgi:GNAT-like C-terminal domain/N-acyltransferase N-terminal domain